MSIHGFIANKKDSTLRTHDHWHSLLQLADIFLCLHDPLHRWLRKIFENSKFQITLAIHRYINRILITS